LLTVTLRINGPVAGLGDRYENFGLRIQVKLLDSRNLARPRACSFDRSLVSAEVV